MKKPLLTFAAAAAFFVPAASAQTEDAAKPTSPFRRGNITIGTRLGLGELSGSSTADGKATMNYNLSLTPAIGYFVSDNWLLLASLHGGISGMKYDARYTSLSAGFGLGGRYYFGKSLNSKSELNRFRVYAEAGANFSQGWGKMQNDSATLRSAAYGVDFSGGVGFNYLMTDNLAFESGLSYNRNLYNSRNFIQNAHVQLEIGVRVFLNRSSR